MTEVFELHTRSKNVVFIDVQDYLLKLFISKIQKNFEKMIVSFFSNFIV